MKKISYSGYRFPPEVVLQRKAACRAYSRRRQVDAATLAPASTKRRGMLDRFHRRLPQRSQLCQPERTLGTS